MIIVSDTSVIINLAIIEQLQLLPRLFTSIIIPEAVFNEIVINGNNLPGAYEIQQATWVNIKQCKDYTLVNSLLDQIDIGEAESIALALELNASTLLIDEKMGRHFAEKYNLHCIGVLGILLEAKRLSYIPAIKPHLDRLITDAHFFIHAKLYQQVLELARENL